MEDIIQILFYVAVVAIAIVSRITNNKEKSATPSPEDVLKEAFPDMKVEQEEPLEVHPAKSIYQEVVIPKQTFNHINPTPRIETPRTPPPASPKPIRKIRINTREEARRAFIHSEIFNRKY